MIRSFAVLLLTLLLTIPMRGGAGVLVIVGGGLEPDNGDVYRAFINAMPDPANDRVAVLPTASGEPASAAESFIRALGRYGVASDRIDIVKLAVKDDPATRDVDESAWSGNARSATEVSKIDRAGGIWMTGGDQRRLTQTLRGKERDSAMLETLRRRLAEGAVIGGTSAGAAVMSDPMITGGNPLLSLTRRAGEESKDTLKLGSGLGFLPGAIVDQHFGERARIGRLSMAVASRTPVERLGFGVDENTAMVASLAEASFEVVGTGHVTIVDGRDASFAAPDGRFAGLGLRVSVLTAGDRYQWDHDSVTVDATRQATVGREYFDVASPGGGGMAVPQPPLVRLLATELLDNSASATLTRVSFRDDGRGVIYRFTQDAESAGFWGRDNNDRSRYSVTGVLFDIVPATVQIQPATTSDR